MAQAPSCRPLTVKVRVHCQARPGRVGFVSNKVALLLLLLQSALQPLVGFGLLYDFVPQSSIFTLTKWH